MVVILADIMSEIKTPPAPCVESSHAFAKAQFLADGSPVGTFTIVLQIERSS